MCSVLLTEQLTVVSEFRRIQYQYGRDSIGALTSSRCTNDETYIVQKLVRAGFERVTLEPTRIYRASDARQFLDGAGLPADGLAEQMDGWNDAQHEQFQKTEMVKLTHIWGEETAKNIAIACDFIREVDAVSPGLVQFLNSGIGNAASVVIQAYHQAQRLAVRNGIKL